MSTRYTAFADQQVFASGTDLAVALAIRGAPHLEAGRVLVFDDLTGRQIDLDLRGTDEEIAGRYCGAAAPEEGPRPQGRPRLGVIPREVTLLPRHWDWLNRQSGGASAALRRLVDAARKQDAGVQDAQAAADRFMVAMLGNQAGYEEASRALYARDLGRFEALTEGWPGDLRDYARRLAAGAFGAEGKRGNPGLLE